MSETPRSKTADHLPPGADRFWGQVSETRAGRSHGSEDPGEEKPGPEQEAKPEQGPACLEWCPICRSADLVRATTSPEAIGQVQAIQHEAINVLKSFLAAYGERSGEPHGSGGRPGDSEPGSSSSESGSGTSGSGERPVRDISID